MNIQERQDVQTINSKAEQLALLMETIYEGCDSFHADQLAALVGIAYDLSCDVFSWTGKEERIVLENEEARRNAKNN